MQGLDCKVDVAEPLTWSYELSVSLWPQYGDKHHHGEREQFLTAVLAFVANCRFQLVRCLTSQQLQTQFSISLLEREHCMHDVVKSVWTSRAPQLSFIRNTCSSVFKHSYPFTNLSLTHTVNTARVLRFFDAHQRVWTLLSKEIFLTIMLFKDDAIEKWSFHIYADTPSARMIMEYCVMHVQTCENPVTVCYNRLAAIASATHLIHKLPLPFDLPLCCSAVFTFFQLICSL